MIVEQHWIHRFLALATVLLVLGLSTWVEMMAGEPELSDRIDAVLASRYLGPEVPLANDYEFQRRIYLDLLGRGPKVSETQVFLAQTASSQLGSAVARDQLIDDLLSRDEFTRYYAKVLEVMFTERREAISPLLFRAVIRQWLEQKRPLNELCTEILASDGTGDQLSAAASFIINRNADPNLVTRDIGRIFFGRDVQCAQCHDHPLIDDYEQSEYFGILSFVNRTYLFKDEKRGGALLLGEKGEGALEFASVFRPQDGKSTALAVLPSDMAMDTEPDFLDNLDAYVVAPDKDKRAVPRYSRRQQLAVLATHRENESFNRNLANRLWANMMGQGLVNPVDMHHLANPPISAELLRLLADALVVGNYDLREFLRQIARSDTYQRSVLDPDLDSWSGPSGGIASMEAMLQIIDQNLMQIQPKMQLLSSQLADAVARLQRAQLDVNQLQKQAEQAKEQLQQWIQQRDKDVTTFKEMKAKQAKHDELIKSLQTALSQADSVLKQTPEDQELAALHNLLNTRLNAAKESKQAMDSQVAEFSEEVVDKANYRVDDGRNRVLALANRRLAFGEFVAEARGVQRRLRTEIQVLIDQQSDYQQHMDGIAKMQKWLVQREALREVRDAGQAEQIDRQQKQLQQDESDLMELWRRSFALRSVRGLSAEQMAGAIYTSLEMHHAIEQKALAEWEAKYQADPVTSADRIKRQAFVNAAVANNMWDTVEDMTVERFALPAGSPQDGFFATVDQALTIQNDPQFLTWLKSSPGNLVERLMGIEDPDKFAEQLYLSILCRRPEQQERAMVLQMLASHAQERQSIVEELVWGLVASAEFRFML